MAAAPESSTVFVDVASEAIYPIAPEVVEEPKAEPDMSEIGPLLVEKNATNTARLRCPDCKRYTATTEEKMLRHIRKTHRGENPFQCYMCDYSTYNKVLFEEHVRIHQGIKPYKCSYCPYRSVSKKNTKKHELVHRPDNPRKCDQCGFIARHEKGLKHHLRVHGDNEDLECSLCKQSFSDVAGFNSHRKSKKRCPECKSMFCKSIIAKHRQEAHGVVAEKKTSKKSLTKKNLFTCAICQWEGNTKPRILLHLIHHPDQEVSEKVVDTLILKQLGIMKM